MISNARIKNLPVPKGPQPMHYYFKRLYGVSTLSYYGVAVQKRGDFSKQEKADIIMALAPLGLCPERSN